MSLWAPIITPSERDKVHLHRKEVGSEELVTGRPTIASTAKNGALRQSWPFFFYYIEMYCMCFMAGFQKTPNSWSLFVHEHNMVALLLWRKEVRVRRAQHWPSNIHHTAKNGGLRQCWSFSYYCNETYCMSFRAGFQETPNSWSCA